MAAAAAAAKSGDPRLGSIVTDGADGEVVIVGFPFDEGCVRNGGRAGAAFGPRAFRGFLKGMGSVVNPEHHVDLRSVRVSDSGDVTGDTLEDAHAALEERVAALTAAGKIPFVVGGGNDQSAPNGRGLMRSAGGAAQVAVINVDAHLDVRPPAADGKVHSGSPFRELLLGAALPGAQFCEFACQGVQCSAEHAAFVEGRGGRLMWFSEIQDDPTLHFGRWLEEQAQKQVFVSFDIDAIQSGDCPGVSCPATYGLAARDALQMCEAAGRSPAVRLFDLSEMNPVVEGYRTPRLTVLMFYHFLLGVVRRKIATAALKK